MFCRTALGQATTFSIPILNPGGLAVATLTCAAGNPHFVATIVSTANSTACEVTTAETKDEAGADAALDVYALDVELLYNANLQDEKSMAVSLPPVGPGNRGARTPRLCLHGAWHTLPLGCVALRL